MGNVFLIDVLEQGKDLIKNEIGLVVIPLVLLILIYQFLQIIQCVLRKDAELRIVLAGSDLDVFYF